MEFAGLIEGPFRVAKPALIEALKITHEALSRGRWKINIGRSSKPEELLQEPPSF